MSTLFRPSEDPWVWTALQSIVGPARSDQLSDGVCALLEGCNAAEIRFVLQCVGFMWDRQLEYEDKRARWEIAQEKAKRQI